MQTYKAAVPGGAAVNISRDLRAARAEQENAKTYAAPVDPTKGLCQEILYDYAAIEYGEINVKRGEVVIVLHEAAYWSMVRRVRDKRESLIPSNWVKPISAATSRIARQITRSILDRL